MTPLALLYCKIRVLFRQLGVREFRPLDRNNLGKNILPLPSHASVLLVPLVKLASLRSSQGHEVEWPSRLLTHKKEIVPNRSLNAGFYFRATCCCRYSSYILYWHASCVLPGSSLDGSGWQNEAYTAVHTSSNNTTHFCCYDGRWQ